jgi:hypothetical protein
MRLMLARRIELKSPIRFSGNTLIRRNRLSRSWAFWVWLALVGASFSGARFQTTGASEFWGSAVQDQHHVSRVSWSPSGETVAALASALE